MAKRSASAKIIPFRPAYAKPIVIRTTKVVKKGTRRKHHRGSERGLMSKTRMGIVVGGFAVGLIQKQGIPLPKLPMIGEAGTIGVAAYLLSDGGKNKLADEICTAALTIAAYELGSTGAIVGGAGDDAYTGYVAGV
jgi:hypothetical protein